MNLPRAVRQALACTCVAFALVGAQAATAASSPAVTTGGAESVSTTSATLTGTVNPEGQATTYRFEYGTTTAYGSHTTDASAGNGTSNVSASAAIGSLTPNTTYHYRLVATNGSGTTLGGDMTFTTVASDPGASTGTATSITASSATLTGTVNPEGQKTTYHFEYGRTTAYGSQTGPSSAGSGTSNVSASAAIGSLVPNTTYHYRLVATNGSGTGLGADATFTTAKRLATTTTGGVKSVTSTSATVAGTVNPERQQTTYHFEYGTTTSYGAHTTPTSAGNGTSDVVVSAGIGSLAPGSAYHYRLVTTNGSGTALGRDRTFTTSKVSPPPPAVSTGGAKAVLSASATVTGTVKPRGAPTRYYFQYGRTTAYPDRTASASAGSGTRGVSVRAAIGSLSPRTRYHYRLVATNRSGTTFGSDRTFTTAGPTRVTLAASPGILVFGQATTLTGTVITPGAGRMTVTLQRARTAFGPYFNVAALHPTNRGAFSFGPYHLSANSHFRAVAGGVASAPVRVRVRFRVAVFVSRTRPLRGQRVRFHGSVVPARNGSRVLLQRFGFGHRWHTIRRPFLHRTRGNRSTYRVSIRIRRNGLWRVMVRPTARHARGFSRVIRIHVR